MEDINEEQSQVRCDLSWMNETLSDIEDPDQDAPKQVVQEVNNYIKVSPQREDLPPTGQKDRLARETKHSPPKRRDSRTIKDSNFDRRDNGSKKFSSNDTILLTLQEDETSTGSRNEEIRKIPPPTTESPSRVHIVIENIRISKTESPKSYKKRIIFEIEQERNLVNFLDLIQSSRYDDVFTADISFKHDNHAIRAFDLLKKKFERYSQNERPYVRYTRDFKLTQVHEESQNQVKSVMNVKNGNWESRSDDHSGTSALYSMNSGSKDGSGNKRREKESI